MNAKLLGLFLIGDDFTAEGNQFDDRSLGRANGVGAIGIDLLALQPRIDLPSFRLAL
ncbi:MAG: hypothetical protein SPL80_08050 [Bacilli bacterium]|nr:hypothetical protein [Bacilli bacterium]